MSILEKLTANPTQTHISALLSAAIVLISLVCLAGWALHIPQLSAWIPHGKPIAVSAAWIFLIFGALGAGTARIPRHRPLRWLLIGAAAATLLYSIENLVNHSMGMTLEALLHNPENPSYIHSYDAHMSPLAVIGFLAAMISILIGGFSGKSRFTALLAESAALCVCIWGSIGALGYLYGTPLLYGSDYVPIALPATILFMLLGLALVAARGMDSFCARLILGDSTRARLTRAFMPTMVAVMLFAGWLNIRCQDAFNHVNPAVLIALSSLGVIAASIVLISFMARRIGRDLGTVRQELGASTTRELTEARTMQDKLSKSDTCYRLLLDALPDTSVMLFDREMRYIIVGGGEHRKTGFDNARMQGKTLHQAPPELAELFEPLYRKALAGESTQLEMNFCGMTYSQHVMPVRDDAGTVFAGMVVAYNITERKKAAEALQRADKLDSLAVLAGGIAHDFNNMLAGLFGYIEIARTRIPEDSPAMKSLNSAAGVFDRAKSLTQQLLTFSKGGAPERRTAALEPLLRKCAAFALSGSAVAVEYDIQSDLSLCDFDESQMEQVIDNLVINAEQAMQGNGTIRVSGKNMVVREGEIADLKAGPYIRISVADSGPGIPADIAPHIFDPFFTTKATGSGLGLATSYSIVRSHEGHLEVVSSPGTGSTFHVYLPASTCTAAQCTEQKVGGHTGRGCILIMDDEAFIREIIGEMLKGMGYSVVEARDGKEAEKLCAQMCSEGNPVIAAFLDLTVPGGKGGAWTLDALRKILPDIPIIASSGYSEDPIMARPQEYGFSDCIRKPYRTFELATLMNRLMPQS